MLAFVASGYDTSFASRMFRVRFPGVTQKKEKRFCDNGAHSVLREKNIFCVRDFVCEILRENKIMIEYCFECKVHFIKMISFKWTGKIGYEMDF